LPSDRSRAPDRIRFGYTGVAAQQGRVILDRDFNAQQSLTADRIAVDALDFVGPCGTPDDGLRISLPDSPGSPPSFWSPPLAVPTSPPETPGGAGDFLVAPGTMYVGGQRVFFPPEQNGNPVTYSYFDQPDWPAPIPPASPPPGIELVYLSLEEQEVSAVEDPDLLEVALGGPDTTQRLKLLRRIHRLPVSSADCAAAWQTAVAAWANRGLTFDPASMRLIPNVRLKVGFTNPVSNTDPCDPVATGGYLGNYNQLIRVRIDRSTAQPMVLWGYDDASFLYRVTDVNVAAGAATLTLAADPPDAFHFPQTDQWVEVLTTAAVLAQEPDESDPTGQTRILRVAAEPNGVLCQVQQPYGPLPGGTANVLVVNSPLTGISSSPLPLFVRVWQAAQPIPANGEVTLATTTTDVATGTTTSTGVTVTFSPASGPNVAEGLFWQIAVRPATPQGVYPEDLLVTPQAPDGPRRWACPLAVIDWTSGDRPIVTDCRNSFDSLVELSRRRPGCCTVSIRPSDVTAATPLQFLIDRALLMAAVASRGHGPPVLTVCLEAGIYPLPKTLYLDRRHRNLTLESCGGPAVLQPQPLADLTLFTDGLIVVDTTVQVTLRGLELHPPVVQATDAFYNNLLDRLRQDGFTAAAQILRRPYTSFGVRATDAPRLTLDQCSIQLQPNDSSSTAAQLIILADLFGAAVFLQGDCTGTRITGCSAVSGFAPTYTPMAINTAVASPLALETFNRLLALHFTPPSLTEGSPPNTSPPHGSPPAGPPPAGSPATQAETLDLRVSNALDLVVAKRLAGDLTSLRFTAITAGVLAVGSFGGYCELGESTIGGSEFDGFTFGAYISALMSSLRLQDNIIKNGVAGLWLEVPEFAVPFEVAKGTELYHRTMLLFEEYQLLVALASAFPAPTPPLRLPFLNQVGSPGVADAISVLPPFSLLLTDNQVDVRQQTQTLGASAALRLALYREERTAQLLTSVIVSSNRVYGGMGGAVNPAGGPSVGTAIPAALMTMMRGTPCSITGNIIINRGVGLLLPQGSEAPSLWLVIQLSNAGTEQLAVTGNVLQGKSDLALMHRSGVQPPLETWSPFNADPA
jgi:hypothetical protein